jgi:hypothetical protein
LGQERRSLQICILVSDSGNFPVRYSVRACPENKTSIFDRCCDSYQQPCIDFALNHDYINSFTRPWAFHTDNLETRHRARPFPLAAQARPPSTLEKEPVRYGIPREPDRELDQRCIHKRLNQEQRTRTAELPKAQLRPPKVSNVMPPTCAKPGKHRFQVRSPRCHQPSRRPNVRPPIVTSKTPRGPNASSGGADISPTKLPRRRITVSKVSSTHDPPSATHRLQELLFRTIHPDVAKHVANKPAPKCPEGTQSPAPKKPNGANFER